MVVWAVWEVDLWGWRNKGKVLYKFADKKTYMESKAPDPQFQVMMSQEVSLHLHAVSYWRAEHTEGFLKGREVGRKCPGYLRIGKYHGDFSGVTNLWCRVVSEVGRDNHASQRDADAGNTDAAHSPDLHIAQFQRVCIRDVFVENYMTLHRILSIGDKRNQRQKSI